MGAASSYPRLLLFFLDQSIIVIAVIQSRRRGMRQVMETEFCIYAYARPPLSGGGEGVDDPPPPRSLGSPWTGSTPPPCLGNRGDEVAARDERDRR